MRLWKGLAYGILPSLVAAPAAAVEVVAGALYTAEYTTNTLRTEDDLIGEWIHRPGVDFYAAEESASLEMDVNYRYFRRMYTEDIWQDEDLSLIHI